MEKYKNIELIARIMDTENQLKTMYEEWNREILQNFYMVAGQLLSKADLQKLRNARRPDYMYNLFRPFILRLVGDYKQSMPTVDFLPKTPDDQQYCNMLKGVNDFIFYQANDVGYEMGKAFLYAIIGRVGWICQDFIYNTDHPDGIPRIRHHDTFRLKFDPLTQRRDMTDCKYISDSTYLSPEDIIRIYAREDNDLEAMILEESKILFGLSTDEKRKNMLLTWAERILKWAGIDYTGEKKGYNYQGNSNENMDTKYGMLKVIDFYERRWIKKMTIYDIGTGNSVDVTDFVKKDIDATPDKSFNRNWYDNDKLQAIKLNFVEPVVEESDIEQIYQSSICPALNLSLYDGASNLQNGNFKFTPIFAHDMHPDIMEMKSVVDDIKDPIRSTNLRRNTMLTYLMRVAHGGYYAEKSALKEMKEAFVDSISEIGTVAEVQDGALTGGKIKAREVPAIPTALERFSSEELETAKFITGINDNSLGRKESAKESGILFQARVEQGNIMQEPLNDNAQSTLQILAKNNIYLIRKYWKEEKIIRITQDHSEPTWLFLNKRTIDGVVNDVSKGEYDVQISTTPFGKQAKEREFQKLLGVFQQLMQINPAYVDPLILVEASGTTYADKISARIKLIDQQMANITQQALVMQEEQQMAGQQGGSMMPPPQGAPKPETMGNNSLTLGSMMPQ